MFESSTMILRCLHVFYGGLRQNLHHLLLYFGVPHVFRVDTLESGWIHLKVGIQCVLFSVGKVRGIKSHYNFSLRLGFLLFLVVLGERWLATARINTSNTNFIFYFIASAQTMTLNETWPIKVKRLNIKK